MHFHRDREEYSILGSRAALRYLRTPHVEYLQMMALGYMRLEEASTHKYPGGHTYLRKVFFQGSQG